MHDTWGASHPGTLAKQGPMHTWGASHPGTLAKQGPMHDTWGSTHNHHPQELNHRAASQPGTLANYNYRVASHQGILAK
jgi:hypothetical protein